MPVTIRSIRALKGSTMNEKGIFSDPALIQSKSGTINDLVSEELSSKNIPRLTTKDASTAKEPVTPTTLLESVLRPNPLIRNPISGNNGTNQTKFIILVCYL